MTRDEIIRMALECDGVPDGNGGIIADCMDIDLFASLVAAAEREACADICDQYSEIREINTAMGVAAFNCAELIRARGDA